MVENNQKSDQILFMLLTEKSIIIHKSKNNTEKIMTSMGPVTSKHTVCCGKISKRNPLLTLKACGHVLFMRLKLVNFMLPEITLESVLFIGEKPKTELCFSALNSKQSSKIVKKLELLNLVHTEMKISKKPNGMNLSGQI